MRPDVLVLSRWYPSPRRPDAYPFVRDWARAAARVADVRVLHLDSDEAAPTNSRLVRETNEGLTYNLETWRLQMGHGGAPRAKILLREIAAVMRAVQQIGSIPDLVHAHVFTIGPHALACRMRFGIPYIVTEHFTRYRREDFRWYHRLQAITTLPLASRIVTVSTPLAQSMRDRGVRGQFETIPNPVDTSVFHPEPLPPDGVLKLLTVGALIPRKGIDVLLHALGRLDDHTVSLMIVGDGPSRSGLSSLADHLGVADQVRWAGHVPRKDVTQHLHDAHALVVPSRSETFSVAAAEALASGRPVVTSRCGGPETFVSEGEGIVVEPGHPDALASGISQLRSRLKRGEFDPTQLAEYAGKSFSFDAVAKRLRDVYVEILDAHREHSHDGIS